MKTISIILLSIALLSLTSVSESNDYITLDHNKDYDLPTPDSIAFKNVCLTDGSFYEGLDYSGSMQAIKDGKTWTGYSIGSYSKQSTRFSIVIYSVNPVTRLPLYTMSFQKIDSSMFKSGNIITDIDTTWIPYQSKKFYIQSATLVGDGIVKESYCINNKVTKPNFLKIVSFDSNTGILKARFRASQQVYVQFKGRGAKRFPETAEFIDIDDGIIYCRVISQ